MLNKLTPRLPWALSTLLFVILVVVLVQNEQHNRHTHGNNSIAFNAKSTRNVTLFYANHQLTALHPQERSIEWPNNQNLFEKIAALWHNLQVSPEPNDIVLVPSFMEPQHAFQSNNGTLFIDLPSQHVSSMDIGGSWEQLMIAAISKTMITNLANIVRVKLLVDGKDLVSLGGHVYTVAPFENSDIAPLLKH